MERGIGRRKFVKILDRLHFQIDFQMESQRNPGLLFNGTVPSPEGGRGPGLRLHASLNLLQLFTGHLVLQAIADPSGRKESLQLAHLLV